MERRKLSYLEKFSAELENNWTHFAQVACEQQCDPPEESCCKRRFVHTAEVERWMNRCDSNDSEQSNVAIPNAGRLLMEIHDQIKHHRSDPFPVDWKTILEGEHRCVLVFSILLERNYGHLIDLFQSARVYDKVLDLAAYDYQTPLRRKLSDKGIHNVNEVIEKFEKARWAYSPPELKLHMEGNFERGDFVLPFCRRNVINDKGGTASVYQVAVQEKFIVDVKLQQVLKSSRYQDPVFGMCYQMALKSYSKDMYTIYEWEKAAFSGLKYDESNPIVRYLGCYSHDENVTTPDDTETNTTYNLLLEYGQVDLDEYCADLTNVPPVRAMEIIRFWESLFKVADAIRRVHKVCIKQGKLEKFYDGWHADVKPDNILVVNGEFKLADFGFARFEERDVVKKIPTQYIEGGTDTYGAPEFARMKRSGTKTAVTQTIDTWSFGCVLSVVATWVVLGFQGIRQYSVLRRMASSNQESNGKPSDRFHDGTKVLSEIKEWHSFLRAHVRSSDTATPLILDLIEAWMLRETPNDRFKSEKLCKELNELIGRAKRDHNERESEETGDSVKRALLVIDESAASLDGKISRPEIATVKSQIHVSIAHGGATPSTFHMPIDTSELVSNRAGKDAKLQCVPLAKTPHRREILEEEIKNSRVFAQVKEENRSLTAVSKHHGETTDSPTSDASPQGLAQIWKQGLSPRIPDDSFGSPIRQPAYPRNQANRIPPHLQPDLPTIRYPLPHTPPQRMHPDEHSTKSKEKSDRHVAFKSATQRHSASDSGTSSSYIAESRPTTVTPNVTALPPPARQSPITQANEMRWHPPPSARGLGIARSPTDTPDPGQHRGAEEYQQVPPLHSVSSSNSITPQANNIPPRIVTSESASADSSSTIPAEKMMPTPAVQNAFDDAIHSLQPLGGDLSFEPKGHSSTLGVDDDPARFSQNEEEKEEIVPAQQPRDHNGHSIVPKIISPPNHVYYLEWDVCKVRKELEAKKPRTKWKEFTARMGKETKDDALATHIHDRDIVFVVDNGTTMSQHWPITNFVTHTLGMKVAGLDEDGIDVKFTIKGKKFNKERLRGLEGLNELNNVLKRAQPIRLDDEDATEATDMSAILGEIFSNYWIKGHQKATTVLVLTDGVWEGTSSEKVNETIVNFAHELENHKRRFSARHFTIGFIRFGDGATEKSRLEYLDDELCKENKLNDIIDTCSWKNRVRKLLLGSLLYYEDKKNADEGEARGPISPKSPDAPTVYDQQLLNSLFEDFNSGRLATVLPDSDSPWSQNASSLDLAQTEPRRVDTKASFLSASPEVKRKKRLSDLFGSKDNKRSP